MPDGTTLAPRPSLAELRKLVARESGLVAPCNALAFGVEAIDAVLPDRGLPLGVLHEFCEDGPRGSFAANASLFASGILARLNGPILWCLHSRDLFAPALARVGLDPRRIVFCETWKDSEILPAMEEGLRVPGLAGVVGELKRLTLTPSRRLQLAAEASGVTAFVVCRSQDGPSETNAAFSRWRIAPAPSPRTDPFWMGRSHWRVELTRCRGAAPHSWTLEACDAQGRCAVPADVPDRSHSADERWQASA